MLLIEMMLWYFMCRLNRREVELVGEAEKAQEKTCKRIYMCIVNRFIFMYSSVWCRGVG